MSVADCVRYEGDASMTAGFTINRSAIAKFKKELERELNRGGGVRVPIQTDARASWAAREVVYNNGPTVVNNGDRAQIAIGDNAVQVQQTTNHSTGGAADLAQAVATALEAIASLPIDSDDQDDARAAGDELLTEMTKSAPDRILIRRGVKVLQGALAPIASGVGAAVSVEAQEMAHHAIALLQSAL